MNPVLTPKEMQAIDRFTINTIGIPGVVLMENAGRGVVDWIIQTYGNVEAKKFLVVCGKGNNGGDGLVVARYLYNYGAYVNILLLSSLNEITGDADINLEIINNILKEKEAKKRIKLIQLKNLSMLQKFNNTDFIIDAIFGTGFEGDLKEPYRSVINWINSSKKKVISIDIPSGVNGTTGSVKTTAVKADLTVTIGFKKIGLLTGNAVNYTGDLKCIDISIPTFLKESRNFRNFEITVLDVKKIFPKRDKTVHKYSVGKVFVLAGSKGFTGAASLTAYSALKTGAGAVILGTPNKVYPILAKKLTEVMVFPLADNSDGSLTIKAYKKIQKHIEWANVLVIGPGISTNPDTSELIRKIINDTDKRMVIDADALTLLAQDIKILKHRKSKQIILTPHRGEFSRLSKIDVKDIEDDRITISKNFAKEYKVTLVLKGAPTITVTRDGYVYINSTGNPGMATAGSGDVLTGIIGGLFAQGLDEVSAAFSGVFLHGLAGDLAKADMGEKSLTATSIQNNIYKAIKIIEKEK